MVYIVAQNKMTIDQQAKYKLLDKWCDRHNKPEIENIEGYDMCEDCLNNIKNIGSGDKKYTAQVLEEIADMIKKNDNDK